MRVALLCVALAGCTSTYDFQPIAVGTRSAKVPRPKSNSQFVRAVYNDLIARSPSDYTFTVTDGSGMTVSSFPIDEEQTLLDTLDGVGDPTPIRSIITTGLVASVESMLPDKSEVMAADFVRAQFQRLLGREPGAYELAAFVDAWSDPAVGPRTVVRAIVGSREYQSY
jgi:hypothetical protein